VDLRTNSGYFPIQHTRKMTGFYNREGECLLRGTDWVSKYDSSTIQSPTQCRRPYPLCNNSFQGQYAQCQFLCAAPSQYLLTASLCPTAVSHLSLSNPLASLITYNLAWYSFTTLPPLLHVVFSQVTRNK